MVIIIAGYPGDINKMLDSNPGLKSRFTHFFEFPDWTAGDCVDLIQKRAAWMKFQPILTSEIADRSCLLLAAMLRLRRAAMA